MHQPDTLFFQLWQLLAQYGQCFRIRMGNTDCRTVFPGVIDQQFELLLDKVVNREVIDKYIAPAGCQADFPGR